MVTTEFLLKESMKCVKKSLDVEKLLSFLDCFDENSDGGILDCRSKLRAAARTIKKELYELCETLDYLIQEQEQEQAIIADENINNKPSADYKDNNIIVIDAYVQNWLEQRH